MRQERTGREGREGQEMEFQGWNHPRCQTQQRSSPFPELHESVALDKAEQHCLPAVTHGLPICLGVGVLFFSSSGWALLLDFVYLASNSFYLLHPVWMSPPLAKWGTPGPLIVLLF